MAPLEKGMFPSSDQNKGRLQTPKRYSELVLENKSKANTCRDLRVKRKLHRICLVSEAISAPRLQSKTIKKALKRTEQGGIYFKTFLFWLPHQYNFKL